jgi:glucosylceramidase
MPAAPITIMHHRLLILTLCLASLQSHALAENAAAPKLEWKSSSASAPWVTNEPLAAKSISATGTSAADISVDSKTACQTIRGWGGCFNEKGWDALSVLSSEDRKSIMKALFDPKDGCRFNMGRIPIGESDYSMDNAWYSLNDTEGDYGMNHFSLDRDRQRLIPFIKAAMEWRHDLKVWGSPWSPPRWLTEVIDGKKVYLKVDPKSLEAYGLYFTKFVQGYQSEGVNVFAVMPQNEPCWDTWKPKQPTLCGYPPDRWYLWVQQLVKSFERNKVPCQIWLGTLPTEGSKPGVVITKEDHVDRILNDPNLAPHIAGVGIQYGKALMKAVHEAYPKMELMQTETYCGKAINDWAYGEGQFKLIAAYLDCGAGAYMLWNMVLDSTGASNENWKQSAPISIDKARQTVAYNPQFYIYKHFSYFVSPGARYLKAKGRDGEAVAFVNPDGELVLAVLNSADEARHTIMDIDGWRFEADLPPHSCHTFTVQPD